MRKWNGWAMLAAGAGALWLGGKLIGLAEAGITLALMAFGGMGPGAAAALMGGAVHAGRGGAVRLELPAGEPAVRSCGPAAAGRRSGRQDHGQARPPEKGGLTPWA